jgi:hypothetical protein
MKGVPTDLRTKVETLLREFETVIERWPPGLRGHGSVKKNEIKFAKTVERFIDAVNEYDFYIVLSVLRSEEARRLREIVDALRDREAQPDADRLGHRRVLYLAAKHEAFVDLMCHPVALGVCEKYLGPDFIYST